MRSTASLGAAAIPVEPARDWTAQDIDITAMSDDQNVAATRDDVDKLYASINYLRVIDGEKHIVFLSEEGLMNLGRSEDADSIAAVAADARVTLSAVHRHCDELGSLSVRRCQSSGSIVGATVRPSRLTIDGATYRRRILCLSLRRCWPQGDRLSHALSYVLGYYPADRRSDGTFRRIEVSVDLPGVRVLHRRGYYARGESIPYDRRRVLAHARITSAGASRLPIRDLSVDLKASYASRGSAGWRVASEVVIDPRRIHFRQVNDRHLAALNVAVFVGDRDEALVGEAWQTVDLSLDSSTMARLSRESIVVKLTIECRSHGERVKAVVYDYASDRVGTAVRDVR